MTIVKANTVKLTSDCCELGEGPHYDRARDTAYWLDIVGCKLHEHRFATGQTVTHCLPRMGSVVARIDGGRQMLAMEDGLYVRDMASGALGLLVALEADKPANRSNDGRVHPSGRLWIGTMSKTAERAAGAIYWSDGHEVQKLWDGISIPNSICFSRDGTVGHFADTGANKVWRVALDPATGLPRGAPELFLSGADLPLGGWFDGSVMDGDGVMWNAAWGGGSVSGFAPDGSLVATYELPAGQTSCPCFVGTDFDRLLVTTAWQGYSEAKRAADPGAGFTYLVDGHFNGMADAEFRLDA